MDSGCLIQLLEHFKLQVDSQLDTIADVAKSGKVNLPLPNPISESSLSAITKNNSLAILNDFDPFPEIFSTIKEKVCHDISGDEDNKSLEADSSKSSANFIMNSTPFESIEPIKNAFREARIPKTVNLIVPSRYPLNYVDVTFGQFINVQPSYIFSSRNFYIHFNYDEVEQFSIKLNEKYNENSIKTSLNADQIKTGMLCCFHNPNDDNYYRVQIIQDICCGKYYVLLADFGEIMTAESCKMYSLDREFADVPIYAINCFLADSWNDDLKFVENFMQHFFSQADISETQIKAKFLKPIYGFKYPVSLIMRSLDDDWIDVFNFVMKRFTKLPLVDLVEKYEFKFADYSINNPILEYSSLVIEAYNKFLKTSISKTNLILDNEYKAITPYVYDTSNFLCVISSFKNELGVCDHDNFTTNLTHFYQNSLIEPLQNIIPETLAVFKILEPFFFRGFVLSISCDNVRVLSIDFGFIAEISMGNFFPLVEVFSLEKYPMFSILCSLDIVKPNDQKTAKELMWSLLDKQIFELKPVTIYYAAAFYSVQVEIDGIKITDALKYI